MCRTTSTQEQIDAAFDAARLERTPDGPLDPRHIPEGAITEPFDNAHWSDKADPVRAAMQHDLAELFRRTDQLAKSMAHLAVSVSELKRPKRNRVARWLGI